MSYLDQELVARTVLRLIPDQVLKPEYRGKNYAERLRDILGISEETGGIPGDREGRVDAERELVQLVQVEVVVRVNGSVVHESSSTGGSGAGTPDHAFKVGAGSDIPRAVGSSPAGDVSDPGGAS